MPKIVSNTTPILSLLKLDRLELLQKLYQQIYIPAEVYKEIEAGKSKKYYKDLSRIDWKKFGIDKCYHRVTKNAEKMYIQADFLKDLEAD